jgi:hypothetical protein
LDDEEVLPSEDFQEPAEEAEALEWAHENITEEDVLSEEGTFLEESVSLEEENLIRETTDLSNTGDAMVWKWKVLDGALIKTVNYTVEGGNLMVDCGNGNGSIASSSPFTCTYASVGEYEVIISNPQILSNSLDLSNKNIIEFWGGNAQKLTNLYLYDN